MVQQSWSVPSLEWVLLQASHYEVFAFSWDLPFVREFKLLFDDLSQVLLGSDIERNSSENQLKGKNSSAPNVNFLVVKFVLNHFGWDVSWSTTKWLSGVLSLTGPSKITNFDNLFMDDNVFSLDVPVNDIFVVQIVEGAADLSDNVSDFWLG